VETGADGNGKLKLRKQAMNDVLEPFLYALSQYPDKLVTSRIDDRVLRHILQGPTTVATDEDLPSTSPLRFFDYPALANRLFEYATSKYVLPSRTHTHARTSDICLTRAVCLFVHDCAERQRRTTEVASTASGRPC
jgi:hypothetical protein